MNKVLTILLVTFFTELSYSQSDLNQGSTNAIQANDSIKDLKKYKNVLYGGLGTALLYFPAYLYYERKLSDHFLGSRFSSFITLGTGIAAHWEGESSFVSAKFGLLLGQKKAHLETALGLSYFYVGDFSPDTPPVAISIGYRANKPGKRYVFRTGISWPEAVYVSWGISF
jgi:hypothetical protein